MTLISGLVSATARGSKPFAGKSQIHIHGMIPAACDRLAGSLHVFSIQGFDLQIYATFHTMVDTHPSRFYLAAVRGQHGPATVWIFGEGGVLFQLLLRQTRLVG